MQVVFKHPVCSLFSVSTNPSSAMTTLTSPTRSEVPTSRTGQKEKSIMGTPGLNSTCFAVFGPTDSEIEGRGRRRRRCEGGKGPTQGKSLTRVAEGTRIPLYFDHLSNVSSWLSNFRLCNEFIFQVRGQPIHHL